MTFINFIPRGGSIDFLRTVSKIQNIGHSQHINTWEVIQDLFHKKNTMVINFAQSQGSNKFLHTNLEI
ncbi:hypothetical protein BHM03_00051738 [Ensete ventricosum]|nr:hypothetical protein BHM03_00051738 [Ensete ventricosum]